RRAAGGAEGNGGVLLHEQDTHALLPVDGAHDAEDVADDERRQPQRRLVEQEQPWPQHERARDGQHLLLAAGERAARLLLALGEHWEVAVHALEVLRDTAAPAPRVGAQAQVLLDGEVHERAAPLGRVADAEPHQVFRRAPVDALPREADLARRADHAAHRAQRRRLARAVGAQNRGDAALLAGAVDAVQALRPALP